MWCGVSSNIAVHRKKWLDRQRGWMSMWWLRQTLRCRLFATALHNWLALMIFFTGKETKLKKQSCPKSWLVSCRVFISWSKADAFFISAVKKKKHRVTVDLWFYARVKEIEIFVPYFSQAQLFTFLGIAVWYFLYFYLLHPNCRCPTITILKQPYHNRS